MSDQSTSPIAVVGVAAIMPEAPDAASFWQNIRDGRYSITDVPTDRWDPELYYDPDPTAPDKTYSRIGGWVREFPWEPMSWRLPLPPKVTEQMDVGQQWVVSAARSALLDAGWPDWQVDPERVAVILGNAIGGDKHYRTTLRINFPEFARDLDQTPSFAALPESVREEILGDWHARFLSHQADINEDTMPGELSNVMAGRVANLFNFRGPNFTTDAACASGLAATNAAVQGLVLGQFDAVVTGGIDRNMGVNGFVKFCKIGALSATGTRPFDAGADGFVMGEGAALFVLKRLADAERDGDRVYAVLLGLGGSSDGKGKGITAPNPVGQRLAVERAWANAGLKPAAASAVEAHGTSTRVGDAAELSSLGDVFGSSGGLPGSIALGSVKSNIGHLKAAAGTAGLFKMVMQLHEKQLAPSLNFRDPNPNIDWDRTPFRVVTELQEWPADPEGARCAGVSAFGFGGTNFHAVLEEHVPGRHRLDSAPRSFASAEVPRGTRSTAASGAPTLVADRAPLRGALVIGGKDDADVVAQLEQVVASAAAGRAPRPVAPDPSVIGAAVRVAIDHADAADLATKATKALSAFRSPTPAMWRLLRAQGVFVGRGPAPTVAFLYTGQGSQYVNMLKELRAHEPIVAETFAEADQVMTPLLSRPLSSFIFVDQDDAVAVQALEQQLLQTEITQPAVLATDLALTRLLAAYGVRPDMVMGHSLGEYGALVAAGAMTFPAALEAVSARGHEMATLTVGDNGAMAAVFGPLAEIERVVEAVDGNVVVANINSSSQAVIGGSTAAVERALATFAERDINAVRIPVSHAFHTSIVAPATAPLKAALRRLDLHAPVLPIVSNVTGDFYPSGADSDTMLDLLGRQVASPVQFVRGLHTLYDAGARVFVEVGPKKSLHGFVEDVLGEHDDVLALFTNHPKGGDVPSFNAALCGLWAAGLGAPAAEATPTQPRQTVAPAPTHTSGTTARSTSGGTMTDAGNNDRYLELGRLFAGVLEEGIRVYGGTSAAPAAGSSPVEKVQPRSAGEPVVITGAALGLPGVEQVFDDENLQRILHGQQFIDSIPHRFRQQMVDLRVTRLLKRATGDPTFELIDDETEVVKLAGRSAPIDVVEQFGIDAARDAALDSVTRLAIGAGFDALRDAGIPLVMRYKTTTLGSSLPERWGLPDALRDDTGVIFASAFPGYDSFADDLTRYYVDRGRREQLLALEAVRARMQGDEPATPEVDQRIAELRHLLEVEPFGFDRRFLFRCLSMGHSQFAEIIGARGPNTQINAACASTTQALSLAEDWIRSERCRRVVVVSADDVTSDTLLPWVTSGFLASGAAATDDSVEDSATPFDRRRHGMIVGMGAASFVVEAADVVRERGLQPICEVLGTVTANSAFHGTRLDLDHIAQIMERVVRQAESRGADRHAIAASTVFVSHETYTPARGGSASAEINALRTTFGADADSIVIANTKGFTGHAMGAGIEDVVAIKALETGIVPPIPNFKEPDPALGNLNLSQGGAYPVHHALRLAAGFGSQIAMSLVRWTPLADGRHRSPSELGYGYRIVDPDAWQRWLDTISGLPGARLEVATRRLRVVDEGPPSVGSAPHTARSAPVAGVPVAPTPVVPAPDVVVPVVEVPVVEVPVVGVPAAGVVDEVTEAVVSIVAEMTGYPSDLLDLDLDLEADLGVDTVKQAEVFAAVRARFGVKRDDTLSLRDFPTLAHVIGWVREKTGILATSDVVSVPAPAVPAPVVEVSAAGVVDEVTEAVVSIVAEMTGYPSDLLDLDLDLEADLGVDTVKQAEVFAAVRARFGVERDDTLSLRDFPTLAHVIGWVREKTGILATSDVVSVPAPAVPAPVVEASAAGVVDEVTEAVVSIVAEMTGYPSDLLDLDLDLEADLGVDTVKQAEVFAAVRARFGVERDDTLSLRDFPTLAHVIGWVREKTGILATSDVVSVPAPAVPAPVVEVSAAGVVDEVTEAVVSIVAEMTGYPSDLLDLDLDLEADLGVDTVKQAEVFAAVRARFGVERDDTLSLRDFPTLTHVIGWVREKTGIAPGASGQPQVVDNPLPMAPAAHPTTVAGDLDAVDRLTRRVPVPALRPALDQCVPTGVTLAEGVRVVVMHDEGDVADALVERLTEAGVTSLSVDPGTPTEQIADKVDGWRGEGEIAGVYWLAALDDEGPHESLDLDGWREALRRRVKALYATMRTSYDESPFLVTGTRLGGFHGYDEAGATAPMGGAVTGFAKSYKRERPDALVKAVDAPLSCTPAALADLLVGETLRDPGCVEIGHADEERWGVGLADRPFPPRDAPDETAMTLGPDSVVLVTGAAGSIVSAITADLAAASGGIFHLLDLTAAPDPEDPDLRQYLDDRDAFRSVLVNRAKERGERPTPVAIERELSGYERLASALCAIDAVHDAGGTAHYHCVDLADADAVSAVMRDVREVSGRVDLLLHAAGLEISRSLPDKSPEEYDLVHDVKADGWFNLTSSTSDLPIGASVVFSSVAARFGNAGQTDYSAANDLLCKITSSLRRTRPGTRALALDWSAWGGIGMASRGSIPEIMRMAGVEMLPPEAGVAWIRRELTAPAFSGEVVVAGALGRMADGYHPTGGVDPIAVEVTGAGCLVDEVVEANLLDGLVVRTTLDPARQPFLDHHRIEGVAVLPGVMGLEAFAEVSRLLLPEWSVVGLEDVDFLAPVKFHRDEPRILTISALIRPDGPDRVADCRLEAERVLPGTETPQRTVHFTGSVRFCAHRPEPEAEDLDALARVGDAPVLAPSDVYRLYFHGLAYQVVGEGWRRDGVAVGRLAPGLPPDTDPATAATILEPRLVELCFQVAGLWESGNEGRLGLPAHLDRVRLFGDPPSTETSAEILAVATPLGAEPSAFDCRVVDPEGRVVVRLEGYRTVSLPGPLPDEVRAPLRAAMADEARGQ